MMLRHPVKVTGFFGIDTHAPYVQRDLSSMRNAGGSGTRSRWRCR